jgi:putative Mn2+ efflux pump MntP
LSILALVLISVGLSVDCFAVAIAAGMKFKEMKIFHALKIGLFFGGFQAGMTLLGWLGGSGFKKVIENFDHWVAFGLLLAAAIHMVFEAFEKEEDCGCDGKEEKNPFDTGVLLVMAFATSIDALAVGISFGLIAVSIITAAAIIGAGSFILSFAGTYIGKTAGGIFGRKINLLGAAILIGIGVKILLEHLEVIK